MQMLIAQTAAEGVANRIVRSCHDLIFLMSTSSLQKRHVGGLTSLDYISTLLFLFLVSKRQKEEAKLATKQQQQTRNDEKTKTKITGGERRCLIM